MFQQGARGDDTTRAITSAIVRLASAPSGSALRADPFGADGLDRASMEPTAGSCVMARFSDSAASEVANADDAIGDAHATRVHNGEIPITRCRELLGKEAESMTDRGIAMIRQHAESMARILVEMYQEHCRTPE
jgi:hypothetical protein